MNIIFKHSVIENKIPLLEDLEFGEIALNTFNGSLYFKWTEIIPGYDTVIDVIPLGGNSASVKTIRFLSDGNTVYDFEADISLYNTVFINGKIIPPQEYTIAGEILTIPGLLNADRVLLLKTKISSILPAL